MKMPSYSVPLSLEAMDSLAPGRWMNGETIDYYIDSVLKQTKSNVFLVKPTWFADGEKKRLEQTKKIMLNEYAIAPFNTENKTHWAILWISLKNNKMQWFDSQPIYKLKKYPQLKKIKQDNTTYTPGVYCTMTNELAWYYHYF